MRPPSTPAIKSSSERLPFSGVIDRDESTGPLANVLTDLLSSMLSQKAGLKSWNESWG